MLDSQTLEGFVPSIVATTGGNTLYVLGGPYSFGPLLTVGNLGGSHLVTGLVPEAPIRKGNDFRADEVFVAYGVAEHDEAGTARNACGSSATVGCPRPRPA